LERYDVNVLSRELDNIRTVIHKLGLKSKNFEQVLSKISRLERECRNAISELRSLKRIDINEIRKVRAKIEKIIAFERYESGKYHALVNNV